RMATIATTVMSSMSVMPRIRRRVMGSPVKRDRAAALALPPVMARGKGSVRIGFAPVGLDPAVEVLAHVQYLHPGQARDRVLLREEEVDLRCDAALGQVVETVVL